ncbi:pentapeptide repeat-containing protein [Segetibacter aerophilus]|nr:pentapeptide repeat-containing protein [Segetibacter aerophilus]
MSQEIFISYRRKDTGGYAGRLFDYLKKEYGAENVLFDIEVDATVEELRSWVKRVIPRSAVVIILIGENWLENSFKRRRLDEKDDIVCLEIELAIKNEVPLIPLLVDGANFPNISELPQSIQKIALYKGYEINNSFWKAKFQVLIHAISSIIKNHTPIINKGVKSWNSWRKENESIHPNLEGANLEKKNLEYIDLSFSILRRANLRGANLRGAILHHADFTNAILEDVNLESSEGNETDFIHADLTRANFKNALFNKADFSHANMNEANLTGTFLEQCQVFGVSIWDAKLDNAQQRNLYLGDPKTGNTFAVDSIETAVVIHLLLSGGGIKNIVDTITSKSILILGRFTPERKVILDALRDALRKHNYIPLLFDFQKPQLRDITEIISLLAHMSRFIIADLTDATMIMHELSFIIPNLPSIPIVSICEANCIITSMFEASLRYPWVLKPVLYKDEKEIIEKVYEIVIAPAEEIIAARKNSLIERDKNLQ